LCLFEFMLPAGRQNLYGVGRTMYQIDEACFITAPWSRLRGCGMAQVRPNGRLLCWRRRTFNSTPTRNCVCQAQTYTSCGARRTVGPSVVSCCDGRCAACTCTSGVDPALMGPLFLFLGGNRHQLWIVTSAVCVIQVNLFCCGLATLTHTLRSVAVPQIEHCCHLMSLYHVMPTCF